ncbi:sialidase family protein [uncultured Schumannella sp.]|uniref:WD40/YVTN/BNR-like repeat-containing protein n=1 Tax=uncultured Schumannella sp. TaxID=1195956 RepID=UPI0025DB01A4|nr:sialidase family protein [uncultured Schumannella sp.]
MNSEFRAPVTGVSKKVGLVAATVVALVSGCAAASDSSTPETTAAALSHVHQIVAAPSGDQVTLGTHAGLYTISRDGVVAGPLGDADFDAMGLAVSAGSFVASGHPGATTPSELGSPHLGIIRSDDNGESWYSQAFASDEDFHVLTSGPDGVLYGVGSSTAAVRASVDGGATWSVGAEVGAVDLTVTADGWLIAATEAGLQQSGDGGATFEVIGSTPLLYQLATTPDGVIVGVDIAGVLWRSADAVNWESFGTATGGVQALGVSADGAVVLIDDRGLIWINDSIETIIPLG